MEPDQPREVEFPMPGRLIAVGDLNGDDDGLAAMLRALRVTDAHDRWIGEDVHLVQVGDVVNRGGGARAALDRLVRLKAEAQLVGGRVDVLLGNHEAMVALGNLAWCTPEEILSFATFDERAAYEAERSRAIYELLGEATSLKGTLPIIGRLRAWEELHCPGREAYLDAMGPEGPYGQFLRALPLAIRVGPVLLTHGGLSYDYARMGLEELDRRRVDVWSTGATREAELGPNCLLFDDTGPLWNRSFALGDGPDVEEELLAVLQEVGARTVVVGHTRTEQMPGGRRGYPHSRFDGRFICSDVGIGHSGGTLSAVVFEGEEIYAWRIDDPRVDMGRIPDSPEHEVTERVVRPKSGPIEVEIDDDPKDASSPT
jgi:hypothetical protein